MSADTETFRDPLLSIFQSTVTEVASRIDGSTTFRSRQPKLSAGSQLPQIAAQIARREVGLPEAPSSPGTRGLSKTQTGTLCAELAWRYVKAAAGGDGMALALVEAEYVGSTCDAAWLSTLKEYHRYFGISGDKAAIPYIRAAGVGPQVITIPPNATLGLVADWGTGAGPAQEVLIDIAKHDPTIFLHLGDIYYSGTSEECHTNFLEPIEKLYRKGHPKPVYVIPGNHDMYCGGLGFYDLIKRLNPEPAAQRGSFFCLRSKDEAWQILGMDTGLHDNSPYAVSDALTWIEEDELAWHCDRVREFKGKTILLSHHQPFSAFAQIGPTSSQGKRTAANPHLIKAFQTMAAHGKISAWFWGHEHTLSIYQSFMGIQRGRCIGHGAIPVSKNDDVYKILDGLDHIPALIEGTKMGSGIGVWDHGYTLLSLEGATCRAEYFEIGLQGRKKTFTEVLV